MNVSFGNLSFLKDFCFLKITVRESKNDPGVLIKFGFCVNADLKLITELAAQIQPDSRGVLILPAITAAKTFLENPADLFRFDAASIVFYNKRQIIFLAFCINPDLRPAFSAVFYTVGKNLI